MADDRFPPPRRTVSEMVAAGLHEPMVAAVARLNGVEPTHIA